MENSSGETLERILDMLTNDTKFFKLLETLYELSSKYKVNENSMEINLPEIIDFIKFAENDLKSAKILYKYKIYPTAIYHLQQSVEKFVKAYMLMFFGLSKKVIKRHIGHDSPKAFLKLLEKYGDCLNALPIYVKIACELDIHIPKISNQDIRKFEKIINASRKQIAEMSSEEIRNFINLGIKLKEILNSKETINEITKLLVMIKEILEEQLSKIEALDEHDRDYVINFIDRMLETLEDALKLHSNFLILYILSVITYPHATFARYPNKTLPLEKYNESLGIVKCFSGIVDLLEDVTSSWKFLCDQNS